MKKSLSLSRLAKLASFTLVELLVVIAIIAILAGVLLSVFGTVIQKAKLAKAQNTATQIQTAVLGYYTEYSVYPATGTGDYVLDDTSISGTAWGSLICVLCGNVEPASPSTTFTPTSITNSRGIAFLTLKASDVAATTTAYPNAPLNPLPTSSNLFFNIAIDSDYDGLLGTTGNSQNKLPNFAKSTTTAMDYTGTSTAGVAVWANCNGTTTRNNPAFWAHTY
jgi:prepilin-type N-terminal cleavage/methylation domain-containing protein